MSQGAFNLNLLGRLGNQMFSACFALAYCKRHDLDLRIEGDSILEKIFDLKFGRFKERFQDRQRTESTLDPNGEGDVEFTGYCQNQQSLIYTEAQAWEWFTMKPELVGYLKANHQTPSAWPVIHLRRGDYEGAGYQIVGHQAYLAAMREHDRSNYPLHRIVSDACPVIDKNLPVVR